MIPPFMHGAAQWAAYNMVTMGGRLVIPDDVERMRAARRAAARRAREGAEHPRRRRCDRTSAASTRSSAGDYDLSSLVTFTNGGAPLSPTVRDRILAALPHVMVMDAVGASESGAQMSTFSAAGAESKPATFTPQSDTAVVSADLDRVLGPGEGQGWLARRDLIPLGYLGDADKTARTFPTIDGVRWSVPGDRANVLEDGRIELLGRDSVTINSGGEKIFVEEVERAVAAHPERLRRRRRRPAVGALGQRGRGSRPVRRRCVAPPTKNSPRSADSRSRATRSRRRSSVRPRSCARPQARPTTAGPRKWQARARGPSRPGRPSACVGRFPRCRPARRPPRRAVRGT